MPPRRSAPSPHLQALRELAADPAAQTALALKVLATDKDVQAIRAALDVLKRQPTPAARPVLRERFEYYAADGVRRDAGTYLRASPDPRYVPYLDFNADGRVDVADLGQWVLRISPGP